MVEPAFFGLGVPEVIVLLLVLLLLVVVPIGLFVLVVALARRSGGPAGRDTVAQLRAEIDRLRAEVDSLRQRLAAAGPAVPPASITERRPFGETS